MFLLAPCNSELFFHVCLFIYFCPLIGSYISECTVTCKKYLESRIISLPSPHASSLKCFASPFYTTLISFPCRKRPQGSSYNKNNLSPYNLSPQKQRVLVPTDCQIQQLKIQAAQLNWNFRGTTNIFLPYVPNIAWDTFVQNNYSLLFNTIPI